MGRFAQADSIVPLQSQGVQAWDRYAYVNNNPLRYTDPTGHFANILVGMGVGFLGGMAVSYGRQVATNVVQNGLSSDAFTKNIDFKDMAASALVGAAAGGLIGSGVGAGAGVAMLGLSGETAMAAGIGMAASAVGYDAASVINRGEGYSTGGMMGTAVIGGIAGGASAELNVALTSPLETSLKENWFLRARANVLVNGAAATAQSLITGSSPSTSVATGTGTGLLVWSTEVVLAGTPQWVSSTGSSFIRSFATEFMADTLSCRARDGACAR